jgi:predicted transcriptional regulator
VTPTELQNEFQLSSTTVPKALYRWVKRGLLERAERGLYGLGKEGEKRLKYYGF